MFSRRQSYYQDASSSHSSRRRISLNRNYSLDELNDSISERILARLPVADLYGCQFVCERWMSLINTPSFMTSYYELFRRRPWFFMLDSKQPANAVYDMEINSWRHVYLPIPTDINGSPRIPVSSSGSLTCFMSKTGILIVCNLLNGLARSIPRLEIGGHIRAIVMHSFETSYKIFVIFKKNEMQCVGTFSSMDDIWTETPAKLLQVRYYRRNNNHEEDMFQVQVQMVRIRRITKIEGTPMKQFSGVTILGDDGQVMVYFLSPSGRLVGYDTLQGVLVMYPRLFLQGEICAIDVAACEGHVLVMILKEETNNAVLRVWEFDHQELQWTLISVMPFEMSDSFFGLEVDISCAGHGNCVMVCMSSEKYSLNQVVLYNMSEDTWEELPRCIEPCNGHLKRFVSAYSFMPNNQAKV